MKKKSSLLNNLLIILRLAKFRAWKLAIPLGFSFIASLFDGFSAGLFIPVLQGLIGRDFKHILSMPGLKQILGIMPQLECADDFSLFVYLLILIALCGSTKIIFDTLSFLTLNKYCSHITRDLRIAVFDRYLRFGKMFFDNENLGHLMAVCKNYPVNLAIKLMDLKHALQWLMLLIVYLCIMFSISWKLTLFALILFPFHHFATTWLIRKIKISSHDLVRADRDNHNYLSNAISSMTLIKTANEEDAERIKHFKLTEELRLAQLSRDKKNLLLEPIKQTILLVTIFLFILGIGHMVSNTQTINISTTLVFLYLLRRSASSFGTITSIQSTLATLSGELSELLNMFDDRGKFLISNGDKKLESIRKGIAINKLQFAYSSGRRAIKNLSFFIPSHRTTAIVGKTGSGKTSIINLLLRLYDCEDNSILIDDIDIKDYEISSLRKSIAYISQEQYLFNDSIYNNLIYGIKKLPSKEEVVQTLRIVQLEELIASVPDGIDSIIGDRGTKLSGGEKQRIIIARALLQDPTLIIMDEATSALDVATEEIITDAVLKFMKNKTIVLITHRLLSIKHADNIVVLDDGEIVEQGSLDYLLSLKGKFADLWGSHFSLEDSNA